MKSAFTKIRAVMARRILVNFRVEPEVLRPLLPSPLRPKLVQGWGLAGICLIRLEKLRPALLPAAFGLSSENAAHRIAVQWANGETGQEGVYIPRRHTNSMMNLWAGGRLFPGVHQEARIHSDEKDGSYRVELKSRDGQTEVVVAARRAVSWPGGSVFASLAEASEFIRGGCCGWSPDAAETALEGVELCVDHWSMEPLVVDHVSSSFFADARRFPPGAVHFDSALLMRQVDHGWRVLEASPSPRAPARRHHHGPSSLFEFP